MKENRGYKHGMRFAVEYFWQTSHKDRNNRYIHFHRGMARRTNRSWCSGELQFSGILVFLLCNELCQWSMFVTGVERRLSLRE